MKSNITKAKIYEGKSPCQLLLIIVTLKTDEFHGAPINPKKKTVLKEKKNNVLIDCQILN